MKVYEHNQSAIDNVLLMLNETNKCCVVHPTGTGKAVIIAKLIEKFKEKRCVVFSPSTLIEKEVSKHTKSGFSCYTFAGLGVLSSKELKNIKADYFFLDEFHRVGARFWGKLVKKIASQNPDSKFIGTSATPIRYLDDHRDMSTEFFDGNVASYISLNQAIAMDILPIPRYIASLYSVKKEYRKLVKKIIATTSNKLLAEKIKQSVINWSKSNGLEVILKKHLKKDDKKFIVFCSKFSEIESVKKKLIPVFKSIHGDCLDFTITSYTSEVLNNRNLKLFKKTQKTALLFSVDKFNEAIHLDSICGIDGVILTRYTSSPIIFYQQIGRCLSVSMKKQPIIFDLVNNFNSIMAKYFQSSIKEGYRKLEEDHSYITSNYGKFGRAVSNKDLIDVSFHDETKELKALFVAFSNEIDTWNAQYKQLKIFTEKGEKITRTNHQSLYDFIRYNKIKYRNGTLEKEKADRFKVLNISLKSKNRWESMFEKYKTEKNNPGESLYRWIVKQRFLFNKGELQKAKVKKLKEAGFDFSAQKEKRDFTKMLKKYSNYLKNGGRKEKSLYHWEQMLRKRYKDGTLGENEKKQLEKIRFQFKVYNRKSWDERLEEFEKGHKSRTLMTWASNQRAKYRNNELSPSQIEKLKSVGFSFEGYQKRDEINN